jgi:hypothetical protein
MKKAICVLGMIGLLTVGTAHEADAQFGTAGRSVSGRATGAIIGGGLGAAAGAIIHKRDPLAGGIVGAVLGAGAGYMIGNNEDKVKAARAGGYYNQRGYYQNRGGYYKARPVAQRGYYRRR